MKTITLKTERLQAKIPLPGEAYTGSRYDWSGIVSQVTLDGKHTFLSFDNPDETAVQTRGLGLIGIIETPDNLGYDDTPMVGRFPMLGVGLLKRADMGPFIYNRPHDVLPFQREWSITEDTAIFTTYPFLCNGYAVKQIKTISLIDDTLRITNSFENTGTRDITFTEANHNFFGFDEKPIDSSYLLTLPYNVSPTIRRGEVLTGFNTVSPGRFDPATQSTALALKGFNGLSCHFMTIENKETGTGVSVKDDFAPSGGYIFCNTHTFAVEVFYTQTLEPGQSCFYDRTYRFYQM